MIPALSSLVLHTFGMEETAAFYATFFGYRAHGAEGDQMPELRPRGARKTLLLHLLGQGRKQGQTLVKRVFACADAAGFCEDARAKGLEFGPLNTADGCVFADAKDTSGNSVSVSGRLAQG
jgi:hypothetical protein